MQEKKLPHTGNNAQKHHTKFPGKAEKKQLITKNILTNLEQAAELCLCWG